MSSPHRATPPAPSIADEPAERLAAIRAAMHQACRDGGRPVDAATLIAVSKTFGAAALALSLAVGACGDDDGSTTTGSEGLSAVTVSGDSSWRWTDQGGSIWQRSRNAPRARGPSRSPASPSMSSG